MPFGNLSVLDLTGHFQQLVVIQFATLLHTFPKQLNLLLKSLRTIVIAMRPLSELEEGNLKSETRRSSMNLESPPADTGENDTKRSIFSTKDLCGLRSLDDKIRRRSQLCWGGCCCCTILIILLIFLVIIPAVIRSIVDGTDLSIESTTISNPSNDSFTTAAVQKFTHAGAVSAKLQMNTLNVDWNAPGGGRILQLKDSNELTVKNNGKATLTSTAYVDNATAFTNFNSAAMTSSNLEWQLKGTADVTFIVTTSVYIDKKVTLTGYQNFAVPPVVHYVNTTGGKAAELYTVISATMTSLSNINLDLGQSLFFHITSDGIPIGIGELPNYSMHQGSFDVLANCTLTYTTTQEYNQLMLVLSNYSEGLNATVQMQNFYTVPPISWLAPALDSMSMPSVLPGGTHPSVNLITLYNQLIPENLPFTMNMYNQLDCDVTFTSIVGTLWYQGVEIATVDQTGLDIFIPPHSNVTTPQLTSKSVLSTSALAAFNNMVAAGGGPVDVYNQLELNIAGFAAATTYYQLNVTLVVVPYSFL